MSISGVAAPRMAAAAFSPFARSPQWHMTTAAILCPDPSGACTSAIISTSSSGLCAAKSPKNSHTLGASGRAKAISPP